VFWFIRCPVFLAGDLFKHLQKIWYANIGTAADLATNPIIHVDLTSSSKEGWDNALVFRVYHCCPFDFLFTLEQRDAKQLVLFDQRVSFPK
jgi:hypothetical protein